MRRIKYTLYDGSAYMTEFDSGTGDTLRFELEGVDGATLKIGKRLYKISHGVADISLDEIGDGVFTPEIIDRGGRVRLDVMLIRSGIIKIASGEEFHAKVLTELLNVKRAVGCLMSDITMLKDAVYGKKLF